MGTTAGGWAMVGSVTLTSAFFHRLQPNVILCKSWGDPLTCLTSSHRTGRDRPICTLTHILPAETIPAHLKLIQVQSCPYPVPALPTPIPGPYPASVLSQFQSVPISVNAKINEFYGQGQRGLQNISVPSSFLPPTPKTPGTSSLALLLLRWT